MSEGQTFAEWYAEYKCAEECPDPGAGNHAERCRELASLTSAYLNEKKCPGCGKPRPTSTEILKRFTSKEEN